MGEPPMAQPGRATAFLIHVLTASGAGFALLALLAAHEHAWSMMFAWLGCALVVDAVDGPLARRYRVEELLPRWSGATLDLVIDFLTYVFVPAYAIVASGLMPQALAVLSGVVIVVTAAIYFADRDMKTDDNYFRGFPGLWNLVAFYLLLLWPPPWLCAGMILILAVATFVPFPFIHPVRVARFQTFNLVVLAAWAVLALVTLTRDMSPGPWITLAMCGIAFYILVGGVFRRSV
jgi:phosphatidylcholine synthase